MAKIYKRYKTIVLYLIFGALTTAANLLVFYLLKKSGLTATDEGNTLANAIAWASALVFAFVTNKLFVFRSHVESVKQFLIEAAKFVGGRLVSGLFEITLPTPLSHVFGEGIYFEFGEKTVQFDGQWEAKIFVSIFVIILNYLFSKFLVFNKKSDGVEQVESTEKAETE